MYNLRRVNPARPWRVFLGCPAYILHVSRLYLTVSLASRVSLYRFYIYPFWSRSTVSRCIQLYPAVSPYVSIYYIYYYHFINIYIYNNTNTT